MHIVSVSLLLMAYLVSGIGFHCHVCSKGSKQVSLLLEQQISCSDHDCHCGDETDASCETETYQYLPDGLAEKSQTCQVADDMTLVKGMYIRTGFLCLTPLVAISCLHVSAWGDLPVVSGQAQAWSGQWRL